MAGLLAEGDMQINPCHQEALILTIRKEMEKPMIKYPIMASGKTIKDLRATQNGLRLKKEIMA